MVASQAAWVAVSTTSYVRIGVGDSMAAFSKLRSVAADAPRARKVDFTVSGPLDKQFFISQPLVITLERDEYGGYCFSDDEYIVYGTGPTREIAERDYREALASYCHSVWRGAAEGNQHDAREKARLQEHVTARG